jgi:hypothetical protein
VITDTLIGVVEAFVTTVLGWMPAWTLPAYLGSGPGTLSASISGFLGGVGEVDAWIPASALGGAASVVATALVAMVAIKLVRIVASFFTAGGGM